MTRAALLATIISLGILLGCSSHPNDQKLIQRFNTHRDSFQLLAEMLQEDKETINYCPEGITPTSDCGLPQTRAREYKRLLRLLGIKRTVMLGSERAWLVSSDRGFPILMSSKGYLRFTGDGDPGRMVADLDEVVAREGRIHPVYRPLGDGWYVSWRPQ